LAIEAESKKVDRSCL